MSSTTSRPTSVARMSILFVLADDVQTVSDIPVIKMIVVGSDADADTISERAAWCHGQQRE